MSDIAELILSLISKSDEYRDKGRQFMKKHPIRMLLRSTAKRITMWLVCRDLVHVWLGNMFVGRFRHD